MSDTNLPANEPHRRYLARLYAEARAWRKGFPHEWTSTRLALDAYIRCLRANWYTERKFPSVHTVNN